MLGYCFCDDFVSEGCPVLVVGEICLVSFGCCFSQGVGQADEFDGLGLAELADGGFLDVEARQEGVE